MSSKIRCFVALDLPRELKEELQRIQNELEKQNLFKGKFTEKENLHLTLKFFGSITRSEVDKIQQALTSVKMSPFEVSLGECGVFSEEFVRIIWSQLNGVDRLQQAVDYAVSILFPKEEVFMSHITLARVKSAPEREKLIAAVKAIAHKNISVKIKSFSLMKSTLAPEGSTYEVIKKFSLN